jgi:hypothetical protein
MVYKRYLLTLLCLLALRLQATPAEPAEPIGQRFGLSLLEVLDSLHKEGVYQYSSYYHKSGTPSDEVQVDFQDSNGSRFLVYYFTKGKCDLATLMLPLTELDSVVRLYDKHFSSIGQQLWRTPYGRISVSVVIGSESARSDGKPHLRVIFSPL